MSFLHEKIDLNPETKKWESEKKYIFENEKERDLYLVGEKRLEEIGSFFNNLMPSWSKIKKTAKETGVNLAALTTKEFWAEGFNEIGRSFKEDIFAPSANLAFEFYQYEIEDNKRLFNESKDKSRETIQNVKNIGSKVKNFFNGKKENIKNFFSTGIQQIGEWGYGIYETADNIKNNAKISIKETIDSAKIKKENIKNELINRVEKEEYNEETKKYVQESLNNYKLTIESNIKNIKETINIVKSTIKDMIDIDQNTEKQIDEIITDTKKQLKDLEEEAIAADKLLIDMIAELEKEKQDQLIKTIISS